MTIVIDGLQSELRVDLSRARGELADARARRALKDSPEHRTAEAGCLARVDALLDMYLETLRGSGVLRQRPSTRSSPPARLDSSL
jgi:hypothetical protein